jgi:hypothetical protein
MPEAFDERAMRVERVIAIFDELARTVAGANAEHRDARAFDREASAPFLDGEKKRFGVGCATAFSANATIGVRLGAEGEDFLDGIVEVDAPGFS